MCIRDRVSTAGTIDATANTITGINTTSIEPGQEVTVIDGVIPFETFVDSVGTEEVTLTKNSLNATIVEDQTFEFGERNGDQVVFVGGVRSNILPTDDLQYELGSSTRRWKHVYVDQITTNNLQGVASQIEVKKDTSDNTRYLIFSDVNVDGFTTARVSDLSLIHISEPTRPY